jgi:hypothetical protein
MSKRPADQLRLLRKILVNLDYQVNNVRRTNNNLRALYRNLVATYKEVELAIEGIENEKIAS